MLPLTHNDLSHRLDRAGVPMRLRACIEDGTATFTDLSGTTVALAGSPAAAGAYYITKDLPRPRAVRAPGGTPKSPAVPGRSFADRIQRKARSNNPQPKPW